VLRERLEREVCTQMGLWVCSWERATRMWKRDSGREEAGGGGGLIMFGLRALMY